MPALPARSAVTAAEFADVTEDGVLGGRLVLRQPRNGHRVGHDAILLAAACSAKSGQNWVDLGAGVGAAGLAVARRIEGLNLTLVEIDPRLAGLARDNATINDLAGRVAVVCADVADSDRLVAHGLERGAADGVLMNPPFNAAHNPSPDLARRLAHIRSDETLPQWLDTAACLLRPSGILTLIWRADGLQELLAALARDFGAVTVLPVHPKPQSAAIRMLVRAVKGSNAPLSLLPGFVLADADGKPSAAAESVLRHGAALPLAE
jgi:tRNA1(Val) A37 N6-methylase TrmN6